jgi:hypothetical protein
MDRLDRIEAGILALQESQTRTDAQLAKTDEKLRETNRILSNIGINLGSLAEEFFYYALMEKKTLGNITFDDIRYNVFSKTQKLEDEFDIVMFNGNSVGIIEVKHKVHPNDIEVLKSKKLRNFKLLFPDYADSKFILGVAGMSIPADTAKLAKAEGMVVLRQKGDLLEVDEDAIKWY